MYSPAQSRTGGGVFTNDRSNSKTSENPLPFAPE